MALGRAQLGGASSRKVRQISLRAQPGDRLLDEFYLDISEGVGEEPYGDEEHKKEVLEVATTGNLVQKKGARVSLSRWFSWVSAAKEHDAVWHSRLMIISAIALSLGMWKNASAHPYFRAANSKDIPTGTGEEQEEEQQAAGAVASGGAPQEEEEAQMV